MLTVSHKTLFRIAGAVWLLAGAALLRLGVKYLMQALDIPSPAYFTLSPEEILVLLAAALAIGAIKGRLVLRKAAFRCCERIAQFDNPTSLGNIYGRSSYLIICLMAGLGTIMNITRVPVDIRGAIDVAVGSALIQGSLYYFRYTAAPVYQTCQQEQDSGS